MTSEAGYGKHAVRTEPSVTKTLSRTDLTRLIVVALAALLASHASHLAAQVVSADVPGIAEGLSHPDPTVRSAAAYRAITLKDPSLLDVLSAAMSDSDTLARQRVAAAIAAIPNQRAMGIVLKHVAHSDPGVRAAMFYRFLLQPKLSPEHLDILTKGLDDWDNVVRQRAVAAVRRIPGDVTKAVLIRLLEHEDATVRNQAVAGLRLYPTPEVVRLVAKRLSDPDNATRVSAVSALRLHYSVGGADELLSALTHPDVAVRQQAAQHFSAKPDPRATALLITALNDIDNTVRSHSAAALAKVDDPKARTALDAFQKLEKEPVDSAALVKQASTAGQLQKLLQHRDTNVRKDAALALRRMRGDDALRAAITASKHSDSLVRQYAVYRMLEIPDAAATPALQEARDDPDSRVRRIAAMALSSAPGEQAAKVAFSGFEHADPSVRSYAFVRLTAHPDATLLPAVIKGLEDRDAAVRLNAARALHRTTGEAGATAARDVFEHYDPFVRSHAMRRFFERPDASVVPGLIKGLSDIDSSVRLNASMAIRRTPGDEATKAALAAFNHVDPGVRGQVVYRFIEQPDIQAGAATVKMLNDPIKTVRFHAISALTYSGDASAIRSLFSLVDDEEEEIRHRTANAVRALVKRFPAQATAMPDSPFNQDQAVDWLRLLPPLGITLPPAYVEILGGDRITGKVIGYVERNETLRPGIPPHLLVEPKEFSIVSVHGTASRVARVLANWVRRLVWERRPGTVHYRPGTVLLREGRDIAFRKLRWTDRGVTLLTADGIRPVRFADIAELHLPETDPWQAWYEQLAMTGIEPSEQLLRVGSVEGSRLTIPRTRYRAFFNTVPTDPRNWTHAFQPAWSLDVLSVAQSGVWLRDAAPFFEVPLFPPTRYEPQTNVLFHWQPDCSVHRQPMKTADRRFQWGFGVHADSVLQFSVPETAIGFQTELGLDQSVGRGGCARGLVRLRREEQLTALYKSPLLIGSDKVHTTGSLRLASNEPGTMLELVADSAHDERPPGADPFHIRDMLNWSEPRFLLDPSRTQSSITACTPQIIADLTGWHVQPGVGGSYELTNPWWMDSRNKFRPVVAIKRTPAALTRTLPAGLMAQQLLLHVWRTVESPDLAQFEVTVNETPTGIFDIPVRVSTQEPLPIPIPLSIPEDREVTIAIRHLGEISAGEIHWGNVSFDDKLPSPFALFEDYGTLTPVNDQESAKATLLGDGAFSGQRAIKLTPGGRFRLNTRSVLKIREQPKDEAFRYLRFAIRKIGGGRVSIELHQPTEPQRAIRYDAGAGEPSYGPSNKEWGSGIPDVWVMVEVDLFAEWGEVDVDGLVVGTPDGEYAMIDYVYLARNQSDFKRIAGVPSIADNNFQARRALIRPILDKTGPAVVGIDVEGRKGTGVLIDDLGYVLTAKSILVDNGREASVRLSNGKQVKGQTVGITADSEIGLIKLTQKQELLGLRLSPKKNLPHQGIYVGFSHAAQVFRGERATSYLTIIASSDEKLFHTDFAISGAWPGGPLFDENSDVVGIHTMIDPTQVKRFSRVADIELKPVE